jgi:enoyl-CoA hydratase
MNVIVGTSGRLGRIILDRPQAINALSTPMVDRVADALDTWEDSSAVDHVLITGNGQRGMCAGGDIRAIHADAAAGGDASLEFWRREYRLNARIAGYPKPIVTWMDGLVMGGGIGLGSHASHRLVTQRSRLAMPEVGIGFHPDVGGSWLLGRAPGQVGVHMGLTGVAVGAADAVHAGLADRFVPAERLPELVTALETRDATEAVDAVAAPAPPSRMERSRPWIDDCYAAESVADIVERLRDHPDPDAQAAAKEIAANSPTSLVVTLRSLRTARALPSLEAALEREYRLSAALLRSPDLVEGVRAQIIDKDRSPLWTPDSLERVSATFVDACFGADQPRITPSR